MTADQGHTTTVTLRSVTGVVLGMISRNPWTKIQTLRSVHGNVLGTYSEIRNGTWDVTGKQIGCGNLLTMLFPVDPTRNIPR